MKSILRSILIPILLSVVVVCPGITLSANGQEIELGRHEVRGPRSATARQSSPASTSFGLAPNRLASIDPTAASLEVVRAEPTLLGIEASSLLPIGVDRTPAITYAHFRQSFAGHPILGSRLTFHWDRSDRLAKTSVATFSTPTIQSRESGEMDLWIPIELARAASTEGFPETIRISKWEIEETAWLPLDPEVAGAAADTDELELLPVWHFRFSTDAPFGLWDVVVDARTGRLLSRSNHLVSETFSGNASGGVEATTQGDPQLTQAFSDMFVSLTPVDGGDVLTGITDETGRYSFEVPPDVRYQLRAELKGRAVWIRDASSGFRTPSDTLTTTSPAEIEVRWDATNSTPSQRDAYFHGTLVYNYIRSLDPGEALDPLDETIELQVDYDQGDPCNAFWNGTILRFYAGGPPCAGLATARVADVVYHEYGHAVTHYVYFPFLPPNDINEGFSDFFASTLTGAPLIGKGWLGTPDSWLREIETNRVWPEDAHFDPHIQGLILAGALWDLRQELGQETTDELFHFARYAKAMHWDDYLVDMLVYDDDDADLTNGTPHFAEIINAFRSHGIGDYSVRIDADPLPDIEVPESMIAVQGRIDALLGLEPETLSIFYAIEDEAGFTEIPLRPTGLPGEYIAEIPAPDFDAKVQYYWSAADTAGHSAVLPAGAPEETFSFRIGRDYIAPVVLHQPEELITVDRSTLTIQAWIDDNSGRLGRARVLFRKEGDPTTQEAALVPTDDVAGDGVRFEGVLDLGLLSETDAVLYKIVAEDMAIETNLGTAPAEGEYRIQVRTGQFFDFESNSGALDPIGEWEWGPPGGGIEPWSGEKVWGTNLSGYYREETRSELTWGPIDLTDFDRAFLDFRHLYRFESGFDGGRVLVSHDGEFWELLDPEGEYPFGLVAILGSPGYSGINPVWTRARFPLDFYLGGTIWLRWEAASDAFLSELGWYLDDLSVVGAQARVIPRSFRMIDGENERVQLFWRTPPGIDLFSGRFLGYHLYRTIDGEPMPDQPIHPEPLIGTQFTDTGLLNLTTYRYQLRAVYDEGESNPLELTATPASPSIEFEIDEVEFSLRGVTASDTTFTIKNPSGGRLEFDAFLAEADWSLEQARQVIVIDDIEGEYVEIFADPVDATGPADLASLAVRRWEDDTLGPMLEFRIQGHAPWGDPADDWGGLLLLDTDGNLGTADTFFPDLENDLNIGAELAVLFGRLPQDVSSTAPALLYNDPDDFPIRLEHVAFPAGGNEISFSVPLALIGAPQRIQPAIFLSRKTDEGPFDWAPEIPELPWLARAPRHGRARPGQDQFFSLKFDAAVVGNGDFQAMLYLETNDIARPVLTIPVSLHVEGVIPQEPASWELNPGPNGIEISFTLAPGFTAQGAEIERANQRDLVWERITPTPLIADSTGRFEFLDRTSEPGQDYHYRFRIVLGPGLVTIYGPYDLTIPELPFEFRLTGANPFREFTRVRLDLPTVQRVDLEVFDVAGRRVRTIQSGQLRGGIHILEWDGRDRDGRPVASGIYWLRLALPGLERTIRLVRLR